VDRTHEEDCSASTNTPHSAATRPVLRDLEQNTSEGLFLRERMGRTPSKDWRGVCCWKVRRAIDVESVGSVEVRAGRYGKIPCKHHVRQFRSDQRTLSIKHFLQRPHWTLNR